MNRVRVSGALINFFLWICVGCVLVLVLNHTSAAASEPQTWNFDRDDLSRMPPGFQIGTLFDGRPAGDWRVIETDKAVSSSHVLAQLQGKGAEHAYKLILIQGTESRDIDLSVKLLPVEGKADMGGGLIWRAGDDRNYYLVRANPLEQNVRLYHVTKGVRRMIKNVDQIIDVRQWHHIRVQMRGCQVQVFFDAQPIMSLCDETFQNGRVGLWTKSDAVTYFYDLRLEIDP